MVVETRDQTDDDLMKRPNPAILAILDPLHRSLLNNNSQFEQVSRRSSSDDEQRPIGNDSDEYFTSVSAIISADGATDSDAIEPTNKLLLDANKSDSSRVKGLQFTRSPAEQQIASNLVRDAFNSGKQLMEKNRLQRFDHSKQTAPFDLNVLDTENRCDTIYQTNSQRHRTWSKSQEQITHKLSRNRTRNSLENKAPLSSYCNKRTNDDHSVHSRRALCKRVPTIDYGDSSDVNSETNLVIENMRNRECEMYRKISFNNGYFDMTDSSSSNSYMYCRSNANSVESTSKKCCSCKNHDVGRKSPKYSSKRKCRSFPLTENRQSENVCGNVIANPTTISLNTHPNSDSHISETETNTYQTNSRKITITIKTKSAPVQINQSANQTIDKYLNACESSEESDTTVSDYATLCSESEANAKRIADDDENNDLDIASNASDSDDSSFFSIKSDIECQSETSQYFNCVSYSDLHAESNKLSSENIAQKCEKRIEKEVKSVKYASDRKSVTMKKATPMICIEQELCENRIVTSKIEVDKAKIKEFKRRHKNRIQPQIVIDNSFSEEIFNQTLKQQMHCDKSIIDDIVQSLETEKIDSFKEPTKSVKNAQNVKQKFICDGFTFEKLEASPKYTGKSINRLLAHRIEQKSITSVRRTLLHNVAYAITEKDKLQKLEKKKFTELAPIKPPRSLTASSSSSPLSKQSFESSATVPIADMHPMGFVIPSNHINSSEAKYTHIGEESSVQFGWIRPSSNIDNNDQPTSRYLTPDQSSSAHYCTAETQTVEFYTPKESIDTVDGFNHLNRVNKDFEQFSAVLSKNHQNNLSTPIKEYSCSQANKPDKAEAVCKNCHCQMKKEKPQSMLLSKTGKRIGKAALKRTKTLIGTSKKLLKKPSLKEAPTKKTNETNELFSTPMKDGDNTVCKNRDTNPQEEYKKQVDKSLNLTPKQANDVVALNPSPQRKAPISNVQLLKDAPNPIDDKNDSESYMTPDEAFDFDRVVNDPAEQTKSLKRSPSKMIMKLAKSSKKLFQMKNRDKEKRRPSIDESTHYYKANDYYEVDNKVLLMGEMLSDMRKRIENGQGSTGNVSEVPEPPPSAKKCLFRDRTISTSSGDLLDQESLVEQIATIDLHDEPEPLYAEIETLRQPKANDTMYHSVVSDANEINSCASEPVELKEVYINDRSSQPSKYIMVNNNPKILYATVNRNQMQTRSLETIESKTEVSEDQMDRRTSSFESLDMSLINDFATAVQTELDECHFKMNEMFATATSDPDQTGFDEVDAPKCDRKSNSGSESIATSDMNSGCSSFYRRNKNIVLNRTKKTLSDFIDTLSFDTVGTGSYCESLSRGNDLNSEIKGTITSLEYMPSEMGDSSDLSRDFASIAAFRSIDDNDTSKDSGKFVSFNRPDCDSIDSSPSSSLYRTIGKIDSPSRKIKKMSPSLKALKTKFRNSFRMDSKKCGKNDSFATDAIGSDETADVKSCISTSSGSSADFQRKKLFESICSRLEIMPNASVPNGAKMKTLTDLIRQQQEMRKSIQNALEVCRTNSEFHNSRELVEAEQLMLMSSLKECTALEKLIALWQSDCETVTEMDDLGEGILTIKYLEFELKVDSIFDTHFNYFYVCVCSYGDQVEFTDAKERTDNRIMFNNLKMRFYNLMADFEIRVEIYALRLRKNAPTEKGTEPFLPQCDSSRFRLQGKTLLTSSNLSRKHVSASYHSPRKLQRTSTGQYMYSSYGLISPAIVLCSRVNTLCDSIKIGYQEQLYFADSKANGFLNLADSKQKWDRLWCRIDGFSMHFWNYPQDMNDTQTPVLTLNLDQCNYRTKSLLVDREICPRQRTFKIDVVHAVDPKQDRNRCIQSYFISAENQLDLELWLSEIQKIFEMVKCWNI